MAWLTRLNGETSTACRRTVPWEPIRVESSRGPVLTIASTTSQFPVHDDNTNQHTKDLDGVLLGNEVDDLESVLNNSDGHDLLTVVSAVHHKGVNESLDNGHSGLGELLLGVSTGGVG